MKGRCSREKSATAGKTKLASSALSIRERCSNPFLREQDLIVADGSVGGKPRGARAAANVASAFARVHWRAPEIVFHTLLI